MMKKSWVVILPLLAAFAFCGCRPDNKGVDETVVNYKKLVNGKAVYSGEENGLPRYVVTLWTSEMSSVDDKDYSKLGVSLKLNILTEAGSREGYIPSGDYTLSSSDDKSYVVLASEESALNVTTPTSYGEQYRKLTSAEITVSSYEDKYEIKGKVIDDLSRELEFDFYGKLTFEGLEPEDQTTTVTFEDAVLTASTGDYSDILWGKEKAVGEEGSAVYNGLLYSEGPASFGSYFSESEYGDMWGGFAVSSNRDLQDIGMDYSNQFSVYAPAAGKFAVGYAFGEYGGEYGNPIIEFSRPVAIVSADIANANKTYHYCKSHPKVGDEGEEEDIWVDLILTGYNGDGAAVTRAVIRIAEGAQVLADWKNCDLSALGTVTKVAFAFESNDTSEYGLNVPAFFCIDNIKVK